MTERWGIAVVDKRDILRAPMGGSDRSLHFDITDLNRAEVRCDEVKNVTKLKAPELLTLFNKAHATASRIVVALTAEHTQAKSALDRIRAEILLDKAPQILKEKGLATAKSPSGSEELRQAVVDMDPQYIAMNERINILDAMRRLLAIKAKMFDNSFTAIKKILGEDAFSHASGGLDSSAGNEGDGGISNGFGSPNYRRNT
jgi:hypothetical protein